MLVAKVDVRAGERHMMKPLRNAHTIAESQHGRVLKTDGNTTYDAIVSREDLHLALDEQRHRPLPRNDPQGFVCGVEQECPFHGLRTLLSTTRGYALGADTLQPKKKTLEPFNWDLCITLSASDDPPLEEEFVDKLCLTLCSVKSATMSSRLPTR